MSKLITIAVDAMGGDSSPKKIIDGIAHHFDKNRNSFYKIFGDQNQINKFIPRVLNNSFNIDWTNEKEVQKVIQDFKDRIKYSHEQQVNLADMFDDFKQLKYYKGNKVYAYINIGVVSHDLYEWVPGTINNFN